MRRPGSDSRTALRGWRQPGLGLGAMSAVLPEALPDERRRGRVSGASFGGGVGLTSTILEVHAEIIQDRPHKSRASALSKLLVTGKRGLSDREGSENALGAGKALPRQTEGQDRPFGAIWLIDVSDRPPPPDVDSSVPESQPSRGDAEQNPPLRRFPSRHLRTLQTDIRKHSTGLAPRPVIRRIDAQRRSFRSSGNLRCAFKIHASARFPWQWYYAEFR